MKKEGGKEGGKMSPQRWVENEEMALDRTGGEARELTQVSGDRNCKDRHFPAMRQ